MTHQQPAAGEEGVIKYALEFTPIAAQPHPLHPALNAWRTICRLTGLIGQDPARYDGYGFGNLSGRLAAGEPAFVISGSQTGHLDRLTAAEFVVVERCWPDQNRVSACGPMKPSAESLTHGMVYLQDPAAMAVIHAHSPEIWQAASRLDLPQTAAEVPYGSPEMAAEVARLFTENALAQKKIFSMAGHEDGIVAFGPTLDAAGQTLIQTLVDALELHYL